VLNAAKQLDIETDESALRPEDVITAGEVFLTNAIRGIRPVRTLGDRHWVVGPVTLRLQRATESTK